MSLGTAIRIQAERSVNRDSISESGRVFSSLHSVHTGSGSPQASYAMRRKCFVPGVKRQGR